MFGQFAKIDNQNTNKEGVGLGLYISKIFTREFGGVIQVESRKDEYTKFLVTLPMLKMNINEKDDNEENEQNSQSPTNGIGSDPRLINPNSQET